VRRIDYDLDAALPGMFDMLATALGGTSWKPAATLTRSC
jgi:hypothetical protein